MIHFDLYSPQLVKQLCWAKSIETLKKLLLLLLLLLLLFIEMVRGQKAQQIMTNVLNLTTKAPHIKRKAVLIIQKALHIK